ncbi:MAG: NADH:ubiquinone reductase (Na(+)-transporting) subunit C [Gammaproteobacteria bacterium]|nr:NADH:ubiquinone reductase (Na(+)-transporting) subunit C [Gammaproteobacteria bacterium]
MAERTADESVWGAIRIVLGVAVVCALLVSLTAVTLRPHSLANLEPERVARLHAILSTLSKVTGDINVKEIETRVVELASGTYSATVDPKTYDARTAVNDPTESVAIPPDVDVAGIKRRAKHATVYLVRDSHGAIRILILPVWGSGYQSALHGFLALAGDATQVLALKFYAHGETPGMGARIQDAAWEALWPGKRLFDESGALRIGVDRGKLAPGSADAQYRVDGISGATRTSLGVDGLLSFWLGEFGFGPFLERVRRGEG